MSDFLKNYAEGDDSSDISSEDVRPIKAHAKVSDKYRVNNDNLKCVVKMRGKPDREYVIPKFNLDDADVFLNVSTVLYGASNSGKTVTSKHLMHAFQNTFPRVFIFAPTEDGTGDYEGIVPDQLINEKVTLEAISDIYECQKIAKELYTRANNLKTLNGLFMKIATGKAKLHFKAMIAAYKRACSKIMAKYTSPADQESNRKKLTKRFEWRLRRFYKNVILPNRNRLKLLKLTENEQYSLQYLRFNYNVLVIFDDAMTEVDKMIKKGKREENEIIQNFFFRGRHYGITHMYTMQSDKRLDAELRKNTFCSLFTSKGEAIAYFTRKTNGFTLEEQKIAEAVIDVIFNEDNSALHRKLIYFREAKSKWQWYSATQHVKFRMCSQILWDFCKRIEKKGNHMDKTNKFYDSFAPIGYK
jgi:hypothetical protein